MDEWHRRKTVIHSITRPIGGFGEGEGPARSSWRRRARDALASAAEPEPEEQPEEQPEPEPPVEHWIVTEAGHKIEAPPPKIEVHTTSYRTAETSVAAPDPGQSTHTPPAPKPRFEMIDGYWCRV